MGGIVNHIFIGDVSMLKLSSTVDTLFSGLCKNSFGTSFRFLSLLDFEFGLFGSLRESIS